MSDKSAVKVKIFLSEEEWLVYYKVYYQLSFCCRKPRVTTKFPVLEVVALNQLMTNNSVFLSVVSIAHKHFGLRRFFGIFGFSIF